jgi:hypothetical protein
MRRFGAATVLGGLLLLGASWSVSASDTPKKSQRPARRKSVASKPTNKAGNADVKLENLYVDSEIGQVFTVNLGRADQPGTAGESTASLGSVQIYQLGSREIEPPAAAEVAGQVDPADPAAAADDDEMELAPEVADGAEAMEPAADDSSEEPAAEPAAAPEAPPQTGQTPVQPDPSAAKPPAAKDSPKSPPPAASSQTPPPPPPPIR